MSFFRRFLGLSDTGPGMVMVSTTPPKTVDQVRAEQKKLGPRTWDLLDGLGNALGIATEAPGTRFITVEWSPAVVAANRTMRTRWVDFAAFEEDMTSRTVGNFAELHRIVGPIRLWFHPRTEAERMCEDLNRDGDW